MTDPAFEPPTRRDTLLSSKHGSEGDFGGETCRICRSEGTPDEALFHPCKCSGSIKFVHQECLMEWLSHSHKKHCELCKTPFRFTKLYDASMPHALPWSVFLSRAALHLTTMFVRAFRAVLVGAVWLVVLPWLIRWSWRWMFWFADAGWAREAYIRRVRADEVAFQAHAGRAATSEQPMESTSFSDTILLTFGHLFSGHSASAAGSTNGGVLDMLPGALTPASHNATLENNGLDSTFFWPQADDSLLSSWTYLSELTVNKHVNRIILDIFEGQLITCVVITGFILVFLIREWVVQQQPLVNLDVLNNLRPEVERLEQEHDRLQRQVERLGHARDRLEALRNEARERTAHDLDSDREDVPHTVFDNRETFSALIDAATECLRIAIAEENQTAFASFTMHATDAFRLFRATATAGEDVSEMVDVVNDRLVNLSDAERQAWKGVLRTVGGQRPGASGSPPPIPAMSSDTTEVDEVSSTGQRPPMPDRDISSRATQIQRVLEETDGVAALHDREAPGAMSPILNAVDLSIESADVGSAQSIETSGQEARPPEERREIVNHVDVYTENGDEMPITNAGPDAKINIKRSGKGKARAVLPNPNVVSKPLTDIELLERLGSSGRRASDGEANQTSVETDEQDQSAGNLNNHADNPFHPEGPAPDQQEGETLRDRVASVFREEFGLDETEQPEDLLQAGQNPAEDTIVDAESATEIDQGRPPGANPNLFQRLADWFWGDIQVQGGSEPATIPNEERIGEGEHAQEAPFAPIHDEQPAVNGVPHGEEAQEDDGDDIAAAQQVGLDAEAIEDAEDLEGIFELIGFQGPLIGLFQTSCFCCVLVTGTVLGAVGLPYVWGKFVLSFIAAPFTFLVKTPLQAVSFISDLLIDVTLVVVGWLTVGGAMAADWMFSFVEAQLPSLMKYNTTQWISDTAKATASSAGSRLSSLFLTGEPETIEDALGWNWAFLTASVHAHTSLINIEEEIDGVLNYIGNTITCVADTLSSGSATVIYERSINAIAHVVEIPGHVMASFETLHEYMRPFLDMFDTLRTGALTFQISKSHLDPSLVYWNTTDRGLAVLTGYIALAAVAAMYVAIDKPITGSQKGRATEKVIRDTLRQAGGVLKVILIISIEMLVFPLYCGLLLDLAFLPLFHAASVATRWSFAIRAPGTFCFVHWFVGTCYMFHFALFVGMCRKILRKGVLWFIRDPDDPTFHPVRDVLERNVTTQLRKIAFSALVYGALVILCLGGVIWSIGRSFKGIFPIHWISTEPVLEFPLDLALYNFLTPLVLRLSNPSVAVNALYAWWLRRCARVLRLSHFLFDDRQEEEEGRHVRKTWMSFFMMRKADPREAIMPSDRRLTQEGELPEVYFRRDGKYVLTPCNDQYRPPKAGEAFLHTDGDDFYVADKDGKKNDHFAKVYVPPFFRLRITLFMVCLWIFSAFAGLCATLLPLVFGRTIFTSLLPQGTRVNDIYAYSLGAYILGAAFLAASKGIPGVRYMREKARAIDLKAWLDEAVRFTTRAAKCVYVYGFTYVIVPLIFAMLLQLYVVLPMHTYAVASLAPILEEASNNGTIDAAGLAASFLQATSSRSTHVPKLTDHTIHMLADYALCLIYLRISLRWIITSPTSRAAEAVRRITGDGYLNPNPWLATRFFVLPALIASAVLLVAPPSLVKITTACVRLVHDWKIDGLTRTLLYRYSYPMAAGTVILIMSCLALTRATGQWRARIRDEVYLVGERLHNFGERKPPVGSRSVVRRDR